jgi:hypothetical protein
MMMRAWWILPVLALAAVTAAQEGEPQDPPQPAAEEPKEPAAEEPKEPPAWKLPKGDWRRLEDLIHDVLGGSAKNRADGLKKLEKLLEKQIDGHSALEDVDALATMAGTARAFGKLKKGYVQEIAVAPSVHGFPTGTVKYWLWVPKDYKDDRVWPLLFCLPDNKKHGDAKKYVEDWVAKSPKIAAGFLVAMPQPHAKGAEWTAEDSLARAMISLRHVCGAFGIDKKEAGPATDFLRIILDGEDAASVIAARFPEMFSGAILRGADGRATSKPNVAAAGQLCGLPAYIVVDPGKRPQREFAQRVKDKNPASTVVEDPELNGDAAAIGDWADALAPRNGHPRTLEYFVHDGSFQRHYWVNVLEYDATVEPAASFEATADRARNEVRVEVYGVSRLELFLNDAVVDLNRPVKVIIVDGEKDLPFFKTEDGFDTVARELGTMVNELLDSNQPWRVYPAKLIIDVDEVRERAAAAAAAAPPAEGTPAPGEEGKPQSSNAAE